MQPTVCEKGYTYSSCQRRKVLLYGEGLISNEGPISDEGPIRVNKCERKLCLSILGSARSDNDSSL